MNNKKEMRKRINLARSIRKPSNILHMIWSLIITIILTIIIISQVIKGNYYTPLLLLYIPLIPLCLKLADEV